MAAKDEEIAMLKGKLARQNIEGNDRANQTENEKNKVRRGEGEKIAAAAAAGKQAQAMPDATKAEAAFLVVQTKAEQAKRKIEEFQYHNNKRMKVIQQSYQRDLDTLFLT